MAPKHHDRQPINTFASALSPAMRREWEYIAAQNQDEKQQRRLRWAKRKAQKVLKTAV